MDSISKRDVRPAEPADAYTVELRPALRLPMIRFARGLLDPDPLPCNRHKDIKYQVWGCPACLV